MVSSRGYIAKASQKDKSPTISSTSLLEIPNQRLERRRAVGERSYSSGGSTSSSQRNASSSSNFSYPTSSLLSTTSGSSVSLSFEQLERQKSKISDNGEEERISAWDGIERPFLNPYSLSRRGTDDNIEPVPEELQRIQSSRSRTSLSKASCSETSSQRGTINEHEEKWTVSASGIQVRTKVFVKRREQLHGSSRANAPVLSSLSMGDLHAEYASIDEAELSPAQMTKGLLRKWIGAKSSAPKEKQERQPRQSTGHQGGGRGGWVKKIKPEQTEQGG